LDNALYLSQKATVWKYSYAVQLVWIYQMFLSYEILCLCVCFEGYLLMELSLFWEATNCAATQELPSIYGTWGSLPCWQKLSTGPYPDPWYWTFGFHRMLGSSWVAAQFAAFQERLSSMELDSYKSVNNFWILTSLKVSFIINNSYSLQCPQILYVSYKLSVLWRLCTDFFPTYFMHYAISLGWLKKPSRPTAGILLF
jgi:hypothetical protein